MSFTPHIPQKKPYITKETADTRKAWCICGLAKEQPFCDGSHRDQETNMKPLVVTCEKDGDYAWCGCKHTKTPPFCDGSHANL